MIDEHVVVQVNLRGISALSLLDTGSQVSTISQEFIQANFRSANSSSLQWLKLSGANGLEVPVTGYVELDVTV